MRLFFRLLLIFAVAFLWVGCERPFVEPAAPAVSVLSPDLSVAQSEPTLRLRLRAESFRPVERVAVNGTDAEPAGSGVYEAEVLLRQGLNALLIAAHDAGGVTSTDTVYALYQPVAFSEPASAELPEGRGALAAAPLPDGRILVTGGAPAVDARATDTALQFVPAAFAFEPAPMPLLHARMGHAATALPDGRVLLTGGALHFEPESLEDFVTEVELYDPATEHFTAVPVVLPDGQAAPTILRTRHTATLRLDDAERPVLYLYGGVGNRSRFGQPSIGPLEFMRVFRFEDGDDGPRLVALGPPEQFRFAATAGHTLSPLDPPDAYLVAGTAVSATQSDPLPFVLAFTAERIETRPVPAGGPPRTDHAAAPLAPGLVAVVGGRTVEAGTAIAGAAIFAHEAEQFFALPDGLPTPRWAPSATNVGQGRILIVGGFTATGTAFARSALLYPAP